MNEAYMTEFDKKWHPQYEKLGEFKQTNGRCVLPKIYTEDKSLGRWGLLRSGPCTPRRKCHEIERNFPTRLEVDDS
jgi:hypothetical protein